MLQSMTGFARQSHTSPSGALNWEMRAVNYRYLEWTFRLPESMRNIEPKLRKIAKNYLQRGKIEANLKLQLSSNNIPAIQTNKSLIQALLNAHHQITPLLSAPPAPINTLELLRWPGVFDYNEVLDESLQKKVICLFEQTCIELKKNREIEGQAIGEVIHARLEQMQQLRDKIKQQSLILHNSLNTKLKKRFEEIAIEVDPQRFEQEIVFYLQKADIDEELDRLQVHINEFTRQLNTGSAVGRRLDFILQEMNREANTLGAKAFSAEISHIVVDVKVLIEQMREQVQNVE